MPFSGPVIGDDSRQMVDRFDVDVIDRQPEMVVIDCQCLRPSVDRSRGMWLAGTRSMAVIIAGIAFYRLSPVWPIAWGHSISTPSLLGRDYGERSRLKVY
jgi:hypothetical protein